MNHTTMLPPFAPAGKRAFLSSAPSFSDAVTLGAPSLAEKNSHATLNAAYKSEEVTKEGLDTSESIPKEGRDLASQLPVKRQARILRNLRHRIFGVYRRLFTSWFLLNVVVGVVLLCQYPTPTFTDVDIFVLPIAVNVLVAALARTDDIVNMFFTLVFLVPSSASLRLRRILAKVYEYGGIYSDAGSLATIWVIIFIVQLTRIFLTPESLDIEILILAYILLLLFLAIPMAAIPKFRDIHHNWFEAIHRFAAWLSLLVFWALLMVTTNSLHHQQNLQFDHLLVISPAFWLLCVISFLVVLSWLRLRKVEAQAVRLSSHAIRLSFNHRSVGLCQVLRISRSTLMEWHALAAIPDFTTDKFSILVSNVGDFTRSTINNLLLCYWIRGIPTTGFLSVARLFRKVIVVATGFGIAPCLGLIIATHQAKYQLQMRVLWSTRNPLATYGQEVINVVKTADPIAVILTPKQGERQDLVTLTHRLYTESEAETVVIVSNPKLTYKIKYGMESRGVPAYGPIWDS